MQKMRLISPTDFKAKVALELTQISTWDPYGTP